MVITSESLPVTVDTLFSDHVGRFLCLEPHRRLIAQEFYFDTLKPFVETPDLLEHEPRLLDEWRREEYSNYERSERAARATLGALFGLDSSPSIEDMDRLMLRLAAIRRIDAWLSPGGDRTITRPVSYAGDLYQSIQLPGFNRLMKVGLNIEPKYLKDPRHDAEFRNLLQNEPAIREVEFALFPLAGRGGLVIPEHWRRIRSRWREVETLRRFEATSEISAFPQGNVFTHPPIEMVPRVPPEFIGTIDPLTYHRLGLCPWMPKVTASFIAGHAAEFKPVATDREVKRWIEGIFQVSRFEVLFHRWSRL